MSKIRINAQYAPHEEGTKFYLSMLITCGANAYVLKAHGPIGSKGRVIHEPYSLSYEAGSKEHSKIIQSKSKRGYMFREVIDRGYDLSETNIKAVLAETVKKLAAEIGDHALGSYLGDVKVALETVFNKGVSIDLDEPLLKPPYKVELKAPVIEPVRAQEWGSW
jgi:predicted DNA-binding WGR domain protein